VLLLHGKLTARTPDCWNRRGIENIIF